MVQRVEDFSAELKIEPFCQFETLADSQVNIPVTRSFKDIAARTVAPRCRYSKPTCVLENDWADNSRHLLQLNLWFGSDDIGTRVVRKVRCARTAAYAKWLAGHE